MGYEAWQVFSAESGAEGWIDTSSRTLRENYSKWSRNVLSSAQRLFNRYKVDTVSISTEDDYVKSLIGFFKNK